MDDGLKIPHKGGDGVLLLDSIELLSVATSRKQSVIELLELHHELFEKSEWDCNSLVGGNIHPGLPKTQRLSFEKSSGISSPKILWHLTECEFQAAAPRLSEMYEHRNQDHR
jgi:hypothetical protein